MGVVDALRSARVVGDMEALLLRAIGIIDSMPRPQPASSVATKLKCVNGLLELFAVEHRSEDVRALYTNHFREAFGAYIATQPSTGDCNTIALSDFMLVLDILFGQPFPDQHALQVQMFVVRMLEVGRTADAAVVLREAATVIIDTLPRPRPSSTVITAIKSVNDLMGLLLGRRRGAADAVAAYKDRCREALEAYIATLPHGNCRVVVSKFVLDILLFDQLSPEPLWMVDQAQKLVARMLGMDRRGKGGAEALLRAAIGTINDTINHLPCLQPAHVWASIAASRLACEEGLRQAVARRQRRRLMVTSLAEW